MTSHHAHLVDLLSWRAATHPDRVAFRYLGDGETVSDTYTYRRLHDEARALAAHLQQRSLPGERAVLLYPSGPQYVVGFLGCLYAGVIAVPAYPPESTQSRHVARLLTIVGDATPAFILTERSIAAALGGFEKSLRKSAGTELVVTDAIQGLAADAWRRPDIGADSVAFLQYTSGSTSAPKGVQVSHGNILANETSIRRAFGIDEGEVIVSWLPLFHDMGLIGGLLQPLFSGVSCVLFSPRHFIEKPVRWLQAVSSFGGVVSGGPDFAYRLCVERVTESMLDGLDLRAWKVAFCGAEPVRERTLSAFAAKFASCGFDPRALYPCYGLAEATLFVSGGERGDGMTTCEPEDAEGSPQVACGVAQPGHDIEIVDAAAGVRAAPGVAGEIQVAGPSVARGYWNRPRMSQETFCARDGRTWLRTGDLGFLRDGRLFVTGRVKDLIIVRGRNLYPQDIEQLVEDHVEVVRKGRVAAFSVEVPGEEGIGIAAEVGRSVQQLTTPAALFAAIADAIAETLNESVSVILLLNPGALPKTSSGKLQRSACREGWRKGSLDTFAIFERGQELPSVASPPEPAVAPLTPTQQKLSAIWQDVLRRREAIPVDANFFSLGGSSVSAAEVLARVARELDVHLPLGRVLAEPSLRAVAALVDEAARAGAQPSAMPSDDSRDSAKPLSAAQQRMWFLSELEPDSAAYHIGGGLRLRGPVDLLALQRAFDSLVERHEALRTTFPRQEAVPVQRVHAPLPVAIDRLDLRILPAEERESRAAEAARDELARRFDLENGPLMRVTLIELGDDDRLLLVTLHHIISDAASMGVLLDEFAELYRAYRERAVPNLPPASNRHPVETLPAVERARLIEYWTQQLGREPAELALPHDFPLRGGRSDRGSRVDIPIDAELARGLRAFAGEHEVSLFTALLASFKAVLARHANQSDIRVGIPISVRDAGAQRVIGLFVNTLVLRTNLAGNLTVRELMSRLRRTVAEAHANSALPFDQLVDALNPERGVSRQPLFQALHNHVCRQQGALEGLAPLEVEAFERHGEVTRFDLTLNSEERGDRIFAAFTYSTDLFERETIEWLAEHWVNLLRAMLATPEARVDRLPMLSAPERTRYVREWNDTARSYPRDRLLHQLIEAQVRTSPDSVAVIAGSQRLSYRELNSRANRLAWRLRERGVGPDTLVAICSERSLDMVVALLAILKAGGAYVPLDPEYPADRLAYVLDDARPRVVLAERRSLHGLPPEIREAALCLDGVDASPIADRDDDLPNVAHAESLVYCLYTSGSTGKPKGAGNTHGALLNHLQWRQEEYRLTADDRILHKTPTGFDVAVWEVFWPLISGAAVVVAPAGAHKDPWRLRELIELEGVTTVHFVPPMLDAFLESGELRRCVSLRRVFVGGQAVSRATWHRFVQQTGAELHNLYGPTEASIDVTYWRCREEPDRPTIPIGRPLANTRLHVLDAQLSPAPVGVVGELYIAGEALARGYLHRPGLTAERFIPDPFGDGGRLYRTGDLARWRNDGVLDYAGRADHQVKVRGFRIELGEIEARLRELEGVHDAVVLVREDTSGQSQLVAFVRAVGDAQALEALARGQLAKSLPEYMVPHHFVWLEALPLLPSGKVDRRALAALEVSISRQQYLAPRDDVEQRVAGIWSEVLQVSEVGLHDGFFELGGHSLLATRVVARVRKAFDIELPLRTLFESNRLEAFAQHVRQAIGAGTTNSHGPIPIVDRNRALPLAHAQQRMWLLWNLDPQSATYNISGTVRLSGPLDVTALNEAVRRLIERHEALRTTVRVVDGVPLQRVSSDANVPIRRVDLRALPEAERQRKISEYANEEAHRPFDLQAGPLLRLLLLQLENERHVLIVSTHHIIAEGWAMEVFARELSALYEAARSGLPSNLPPLAVQYLDYVQWHRQWLEAGELDRQLAYWKSQLGNEHVVLELPTDRPRPRVLSAAGDLHRFRIEPPLARQLRAFSAEKHSTLFMTLLAGFFALLHRYSGQMDLRVGVPVANRIRPEAEGLIGAFLNTQVLRAQLRDSMTFAQLLEQVRDITIDAQTHQDLPFERLVEAVRAPRNLGYNPLFQALFNLHRWDFQRSKPLGDMQVDFLPNDARVAKCDVMLDVGDLDEGLDCCLTYSTDLFDRSTIERMMEHWVRLLQEMTADADSRIDSVPVLTSPQISQIHEWNRTECDYGWSDGYVSRFERSVALYPERVAARCGSDEWRYGELNRRSNRVAHTLLGVGVEADDAVALWAERGLPLLSAILGAFKAGAGYVPLDPRYPAGRVVSILRSARVRTLIVTRTLQPVLNEVLASLSPAERPFVVVLEDIADGPDANPDVPVRPEQLAYVIYTSGSTGTPKGVVVHQQGMLNNQLSKVPYLGLTSEDVIAQTAPASFDISVWQLLAGLLCGACVQIVPEDIAHDPAALLRHVQSTGITVLESVPAVMQGMLGAEALELSSLRVMMPTGEALSPELARQWLRRYPQIPLVNAYGPAECSDDVALHRLTEAPDVSVARVPIGRPTDNNRLYVLNGDLQPVPAGVTGELYVAGVGVGRGYLNRPELTAERFVPDVFGEGGRLYRTGDLGRYRKDGVLEYVGRIDHQVKVRGLRIELGEIETRLREHPDIRDAVVLAREDAAGEKRLVGYVVPREPGIHAAQVEQVAENTYAAGSTQVADWKRHLQSVLPEYMVPALYLVLNRLPLSAHGKVDRKALPAPHVTQAATSYVAPRTPLEQQLSAIWQEVLRIGRVGMHDNFFELGGHSLLAAQVVSRVQSELRIAVPLRKLFEYPTLMDFAGVVDAQESTALNRDKTDRLATLMTELEAL